MNNKIIIEIIAIVLVAIAISFFVFQKKEPEAVKVVNRTQEYLT